MKSFKDYAVWISEEWDSEDVQDEIMRFKVLINSLQKKHRNNSEASDELASVESAVEDPTFWRNIVLVEKFSRDLPS